MRIDSIKVPPSPFRRKMNIAELKADIDKNGLIVPIKVNEDQILIDGYRRLQACKELGWDEIEVNVVGLDGHMTTHELAKRLLAMPNVTAYADGKPAVHISAYRHGLNIH